MLHANFAVTGIFVVCNLTFVRTGGAIYVLGTKKKSDVPFRLVRELRDLG